MNPPSKSASVAPNEPMSKRSSQIDSSSHEATTQPEVVVIAAVAEKDRLIGRGRELPWHIPEDLKRFKRLTSGYPLLMGRRTFESVVHQFGGPLPNRRNVVISRSGEVMEHPDVEVVSSIDDALEVTRDAHRVFVGGGATIYGEMLDRADRLELTLVEGEFEGDTYFPPYEHLIGETFEKCAEETHDGFRFVTYERRKGRA